MKSVQCPFCAEYFIVFKGYEDKTVLCPHCSTEIYKKDWGINYYSQIRRRWKCPNCERIFDANYMRAEEWEPTIRCGSCEYPGEKELLYEGVIRIKKATQRKIDVMRGRKFAIPKHKKKQLTGGDLMTFYVIVLGTKNRGWFKECEDRVEATYWYDKFMNPPVDQPEAYGIVMTKMIQRREWGDRVHLIERKEKEVESDDNVSSDVLQQEEGSNSKTDASMEEIPVSEDQGSDSSS